MRSMPTAIPKQRMMRLDYDSKGYSQLVVDDGPAFVQASVPQDADVRALYWRGNETKMGC